jgi:hypothetical protein
MKSTTKQWNSNLEIKEKFQNFHGCPLTLAFSPNIIILQELSNSTRSFRNLFEAIAVKGNFRPTFLTNIPRYLKDYDVIYALPVSTTARTPFVTHYTTQFHEEKASFLLTQREPYSAYEKLLLPFDDTTWIFFIAVFLYSFLSIVVINLVSRNFQDMFYGENVKTPAFNVVGTFFGISQTTLPDANFPRILLMTFILYCLVLRTAYQGVLFEYVATDMRKPSPTTIEELYEQGYTVYMHYYMANRFMEMIPAERR